MNPTFVVRNWAMALLLALAAAAWAQAPATQPAQATDPAAAIQRRLAQPGKLEPFDYSSAPVAEKDIQPIPKKSAANEAVLPPAMTRAQPLPLHTARPTPVLERPSVALDQPLLMALADPPTPGRPAMPAAPRIRIESPSTVTWLPLPNILKLRGESPVRAHEPMLDPTGGESLGPALPVFRAAPTAALRMAIPDPFENLRDVRLEVAPEDSDPPASMPGMPGKLTLTLDKVPPPATQPAPPAIQSAPPATQPAPPTTQPK